jgi:tetratricopeptide (TPR) repeat protein
MRRPLRRVTNIAFFESALLGVVCFIAIAGFFATIAAQTGAGQSTAPKAQGAPAGARKQRIANPLNELLDEAQRDIEKKDFQAAIDPLQKFIAEQPDVAYGHFQLGYVFTALHKTTEARAEYERAVALDPKMAEGYLNLGVLLIESEPAAAVPHLRKAVALLPSQSRPRYLLGVAQERAGDISAAAESFEVAYRLDAHNPEPIFHLADLYLRLARPAEAEAKFRVILEIEPNNPLAMLGVAESMDAEKKPEAAEAYRKYLALKPSDSGARARLVHLLVDLQQYDVALAELDRAGAGNSPNLDTLRLRADIQIAQKKWDDAIVTINKAVTLAPGDAVLQGGLGRLYLQKRDFANAQKELKAALQLDRKNLAYWKDLSTSYYLAGDCPSTLAALAEIAKMETPGPGGWFIRALCYDKLNQPKPVWQAQERSKVLRKVLEHKR